jgi:hypothetical protein
MRKIKQITRKDSTNDQDTKSTTWRLFLSGKVLIILIGIGGSRDVTCNISTTYFNRTVLQKSTASQNEQSLSRNTRLTYSSPGQVVNVTKVSTMTIHSLVKSNRFEITYNVLKNPTLSRSQKLDNIVNELVDLAKKQELPLQPLSISLIDVKSNTISGYQQHISRYPASVVKLFWMVVLEEYRNHNLIASNNQINTDLKEMILKSDNDASSRIVDVITNTQSSLNKLSNKEFKKKDIN